MKKLKLLQIIVLTGIFIACSLLNTTLFAQNLEVRGILLDASYRPVSGALVIGKEKSQFTDASGFFNLKSKPGDSLIISHIGYSRAYYKVPADARGVLSPTLYLQELSIELADVYITDYYGKYALASMMEKSRPEDVNTAAAAYNLSLYSYAAANGFAVPEYTNEDRQAGMVRGYAATIMNKDLKMGMNSGVTTPYTSLLNTNTVLALVSYAYMKHNESRAAYRFHQQRGILQYRYKHKKATLQN